VARIAAAWALIRARLPLSLSRRLTAPYFLPNGRRTSPAPASSLWGRDGDDAVRLAGDPAWAGYLRRMVAVATR
jgi:hypothetical protein